MVSIHDRKHKNSLILLILFQLENREQLLNLKHPWHCIANNDTLASHFTVKHPFFDSNSTNFWQLENVKRIKQFLKADV